MRCRYGSFFLFLAALFSYASKAQDRLRPNVVYIMADDMGYGDLSCYGQKNYQTPNLDKLASQGVRFTNAYAAAPVCTPTRVAFMTGRYPARLKVGLYEPIAEARVDSLTGLTPGTPSVAGRLKKAGYETALIGKWHLGYKPEYGPNRNGFDYFYGFHAGAMDYVSHGNDLYENETPVEQAGYATDLWADKAIERINKPHPKPFFLAVMFNAPHWPWQAPGAEPYPPGFENWKKGGSPAVYAAMVRSLDSAVGRIVQSLDAKGLSANTVVIFTSDNGGERYSDNGIYKDGKMSLWEGGIREPAFLRWPGKIKERSVTEQAVITMDWTATILSLAGAEANSTFPLDGMDVMPVVQGKRQPAERTFYWRVFQRRRQKAVREGGWKWLQDENGKEYLFNLQTDPSEKTDRRRDEKARFEKLRKEYGQWEKSMRKPLPLGA